MLKSTQTFQILQGTAPFIIDVKTPLDPCAVVTKAEIVDTRFIEIEVQFADSLCYDAAKNITVNVMDADMWSNDYVLTMPDPCLGLTSPSIELLDRYKLIARVPAGFGPYEYSWKYNQQILKGTQSGNTIDFEIISGLEGTQTLDVEVTVKNEAGCCVSNSYSLEICAPETEDIYLQAECNGKSTSVTPQFALNITSECYNVSCGETSRIDYTSLQVESVPGLTLHTLPGNLYYYSIANTVNPGTYNILASIKDADGVLSYFKICVTVPNCATFNEEFAMFDATGVLGCENCAETQETGFKGSDLYQPCRANDIEIPIQYIGKEPDFSTFSFITSPGQTLISATRLITPEGEAVLSQNNTIIYTETGNAVTELIRFELEGVQARVVIESEACTEEAPVLQDDAVCVDEGQTVTIRPLLNDSGDIDPSTFQFLGPFPGQGEGTVQVGNGIIKYTAVGANLPGQLVMQYTVSSTGGVQAAPARITINVNRDADINTVQESVCLNTNSEFSFNGVDGTFWKYTGADASFTLNGKTQLYKKNHRIQDNDIIVSFQSEGTYSFENIQQGCAEVAQTVDIEVLAAATLTEYDIIFCKDDETTYSVLNELFVQHEVELPAGGTWRRYNTDRQFTNTITPNNENTGTYSYEYVIPRNGTYEQACEDIIRLHIYIEAEVYAGEDICLKLCSEGPIDPGNLDCRSNSEIIAGATETCIICLRDKLEDYIPPGKTISANGTWYLTAAPNVKGNVIVINGGVYRLNVGDPLLYNGTPIDNPCIDFSNMVLPDWQFKYIVESPQGACNDEVTVDVALFPPPCLPKAIEEDIDVCVTETQMTLYDFMLEYIIPEPRECTPTTKGLWTIVGNDLTGFYLDQDGDGTNDYFITSEVKRGTYSITYQYFPDNIDIPSCNQQTCDADCDTCSREFSFVINFDAGPDIGDPIKWAVCQNKGDQGAETCTHKLNSGLSGTGGTRKWYYYGYNSVNPNVPNPLQVGNIPDIVNGPLGRMWNVNEQVLASHTSAPLDTDEDPEINFDNALVGFYFFRVEATNEEGCVSAAIIPIQVVEGPNSGGPATCGSYCSNRPTCIDLECIIVGPYTPGGNWTFIGGTDCNGLPITSIPLAAGPCTGTGAASTVCGACSVEDPAGAPGFNAPNGTLNTSGLPCGTYIFGYEATIPMIEPEFILSNCDACQPSVNQITIVIQDPDPSGQPGNPGSACN